MSNNNNNDNNSNNKRLAEEAFVDGSDEKQVVLVGSPTEKKRKKKKKDALIICRGCGEPKSKFNDYSSRQRKLKEGVARCKVCTNNNNNNNNEKVVVRQQSNTPTCCAATTTTTTTKKCRIPECGKPKPNPAYDWRHGICPECYEKKKERNELTNKKPCKQCGVFKLSTYYRNGVCRDCNPLEKPCRECKETKHRRDYDKIGWKGKDGGPICRECRKKGKKNNNIDSNNEEEAKKEDNSVAEK